MARRSTDLASRAKESWSADAQRRNDVAGKVLQAEITARDPPGDVSRE